MAEDHSLPVEIAEQKGITKRPIWHFDLETAQRLLTQQFGTRDLGGFGCSDQPLGIVAAGALMLYVSETQRSSLPHISGLSVERRDDAVIIDAATRRNLELEHGLSGQSQNTLCGIMDRTATAMGSRKLRRWINRPLRDIDQIRERHAAIAALLENSRQIELHEELQGVGDIERILSRIALKSARPRDLSTLGSSLARHNYRACLQTWIHLCYNR
jgi:DNA mismatch repair protein MutS